jgi:hypothetical protein
MINVRLARAEDAAELARYLRQEDLQEIKAVSGEDPAAALERSVTWSEPCYALVNEADRPLALFGAAPDARMRHAGLIWLLASTEFVEHPVWILRNCRKWITKLHQHYEVLGNFVDARNETHIRWLEWCDFKFIGLVEKYGVEQRPFYEFTRAHNDSGS